MSTLDEEDIEKIVNGLAVRMNQQNGFYVEPETHYQQHMALQRFIRIFDDETIVAFKDMVNAFRTSRSRFWFWFSSAVMLGAIALVTYLLFGKHP